MTKGQRIFSIVFFLFCFLPFKNGTSGFGVVVATNNILIKSPFEGVVKSVGFNYGGSVKKGDDLAVLLLLGSSDYQLKESLTANTLALGQLKQKYEKLILDPESSKDIGFDELNSKIKFFQKQNLILKQILTSGGTSGQVSYAVKSPMDGAVHLLFPKYSPGNFVKKNDDLLIVEDRLAPKKLLCILDPDKIAEVKEGDVVESVPWLNWDKGILRLTAKATPEVLNREELESYIADQPELFDELYTSEGKRKNYWAFLASDLKCDELNSLPSGMIININIDRGFTTPLFILLKFSKKLIYRCIDLIR